MTEMIERVARAIAEQLGDNLDDAFANKSEWNAARGEKGGRIRDINEPFLGDYLDAARAAIEAMREPPRPLLTVSAKAALLARGSGCSQEDAFLAGLRAMINAALETPPE